MENERAPPIAARDDEIDSGVTYNGKPPQGASSVLSPAREMNKDNCPWRAFCFQYAILTQLFQSLFSVKVRP
jgi:hypothetical protein